VFLCYSSEKGAAFVVDRSLYLPREEWAGKDPARREEAGVPEEVCALFATKKGELATRGCVKASIRGWGACPLGGGRHGLWHSPGLARMAGKKRGRCYVFWRYRRPRASTTKDEGSQRQARTLAPKDLPEEAWFGASAGRGSKGERLYEWACIALPNPDRTQNKRIAGC
jgi:hypothetical protein